nr:response regulator transcription factor [Caldilineaceae bacterium]
LDVQMPEVDGLEICRRIRQQPGHIPILMISGERKALMDRVIGLEIGADKYLIKPFEPALLLAEVRALLRTAQAVGNHTQEWLAIDGRLRINRQRRCVEVEGQWVHLTSHEFDLLLYLVQNEGRACARDDLIEQVWKDTTGTVSDQAVNSCVARLRQKIEVNPSRPVYIESMYGWGYRFMSLAGG